MKNAIIKISGTLERENVPWVLGGDTSLVLQNVLSSAKDVTVLTHVEGAYKIGAVYRTEEISPVQWVEDGSFLGHRGRFQHEGIDLTVIGDGFLHREEDLLSLDVHALRSHAMTFRLTRFTLHLCPLEYHLLTECMTRDDEATLGAIVQGGIRSAALREIMGRNGYSASLTNRVLTVLERHTIGRERR